MTTTTTEFRIAPADPSALRELEASAPAELKQHFDLIKGGLETIPGVPGEAIYGAVTLRTLALIPEVFEHLFLVEHHAAKRGEIDRATKELVSLLVAERIEGDETPACAPYHAGAARFEGASAQAVAIVQDFDRRADELPDDVRTAVEFGLAAATDPQSVTDDDVQRLRDLGYTDRGLVELTVTALVAYALSAINQVFDLREGEA